MSIEFKPGVSRMVVIHFDGEEKYRAIISEDGLRLIYVRNTSTTYEESKQILSKMKELQGESDGC